MHERTLFRCGIISCSLLFLGIEQVINQQDMEICTLYSTKTCLAFEVKQKETPWSACHCFRLHIIALGKVASLAVYLLYRKRKRCLSCNDMQNDVEYSLWSFACASPIPVRHAALTKSAINQGCGLISAQFQFNSLQYDQRKGTCFEVHESQQFC